MALSVGDLLRSIGTWTDPDDGTAIDPTTVAVTVVKPDGTSTTYVFGVDGEVTKTSAGIYKLLVDADQEGVWTVEWFSTGTGQAAEAKQAYVVGSKV